MDCGANFFIPIATEPARVVAPRKFRASSETGTSVFPDRFVKFTVAFTDWFANCQKITNTDSFKSYSGLTTLDSANENIYLVK